MYCSRRRLDLIGHQFIEIKHLILDNNIMWNENLMY
jgi:hypothetical protein